MGLPEFHLFDNVGIGVDPNDLNPTTSILRNCGMGQALYDSTGRETVAIWILRA
jgi:hypothetical protein